MDMLTTERVQELAGFYRKTIVKMTLSEANQLTPPILVLAASGYKRDVTVWRPSLCPSVCPIFFLTLIERAAHTQRDSPGGSMRRGQRTFCPTKRRKDDRHSLPVKFWVALSVFGSGEVREFKCGNQQIVHYTQKELGNCHVFPFIFVNKS